MKNKKNSLILASLLSFGFILTSCGNTEPVVVDNRFNVNVVKDNGVEVNFNTETLKFEPGDEVKFSVKTLGDNYFLKNVLLDDNSLTSTTNEYSFVMPKKDVTVKAESVLLGDESVTKVTQFTKDTLPQLKTVDDVVTILNKNDELNGKYLKSAKFTTTTNERYASFDPVDLVIESGIDNVLNIDGSFRTSDGAINLPIHQQNYINGEYLVINELKGSNSGDLTTNITTKKISKLADDKIPYGEISLNEAIRTTNAYDFSTVLKERYLKSYSYDWAKNAKFATSVNEAKTELTLKVNYVEKSYSYGTVLDFDFTFDGDYFVSLAKIVKNKYDLKSFDAQDQLLPEAKAIETETFTYEAVRGYKNYLTIKENINDYVLNDYDVVITSEYDGVKETLINGGTVKGNSSLNFSFVSKDNDNAVIKPTLIGAQEEGFLSSSREVTKVGTFHLLFDNGLGEIKTIEMTSVQPEVKELKVSLSKTEAFNGDTVYLGASILPSLANQELTVTKTAESVNCEIVKTENNYQIKTLELGKIILLVQSVANPQIQETLEINVIEQPTYESIYATLTTKTLEQITQSSWDDPYNINFNTDGTGRMMRRGYDDVSYEYVDQTTDFTYTIDQTTLEIKITHVSNGSLTDTLEGVTVVSTTAFKAQIYGWSSKTYDFKVVARKVF